MRDWSLSFLNSIGHLSRAVRVHHVLLCLCVITATALLIGYINNSSYLLSFGMFIEKFAVNGTKLIGIKPQWGLTASHQGAEICELPRLDPWDQTITKFLDPNRVPFKDCKPDPVYLTELINGKLRIKSNDSDISCQYRCVRPKGVYYHELDAFTNMTFGESYDVKCDFVETVCRRSQKVVFNYLHMQTLPDASKTYRKESRIDPSVFMFILDSVSSSTFTRTLPETNQVLMQFYDATKFYYHNKVGLNSRPNAYGFFTGTRVEDLDEIRYPNGTYKRELPDDCQRRIPLGEIVFSSFVNRSYGSMVVEDWSSAFEYPNCYGYSTIPVEHWGRPIFRRTTTDGSKEKDVVDIAKYFYKRECQSREHKLLEYANRFLETYKGIAKFGYLWASTFVHSDVNALYGYDKTMAAFFRQNIENLNNSFLFVMGDHGMRFGSLRRTKIGTYEDDNPNMIISVPYWLRSNRQLMTNIHMNSRRHTSHYDLHATLYDIAHIARANGYAEWGDHDFRNEFGPRKGLRAKSLFRPITYDRTCKEMEIAEEYCLCIEKKEGLDSNDVLAVNAGKSIISYINTFLASKNKSNDCLVLNFTEVVKAEKSMYEPRVKVVAKASPSGGLYEAVMLIEENENIRPVPISKITRNDAYGNTGDCAFEEDLKPICFCKPGWEKRSSTQPSTTQ